MGNTAGHPLSGNLRVSVVDYEALPDQFEPDRAMLRPVTRLLFAPLAEASFKAQLTWYEAGPLSSILQQPSLPAESDSVISPPAAPPAATNHERTVRFNFPFSELTIGNGGVTGRTELPGLSEPVIFRIANDHLLAEFNHIKPFFIKALQRKTIQVTANLSFPDDVPKLTQVRSAQIERINNDLLAVFRARALRQLLTDDQVRVIDKSLFTPEEVFASLEEDSLGKAVLPQDSRQLLDALLEAQNVRNKRQLTFLASELHLPGTKLRYVLSPGFGFVFLAIGQEANHFILELLDSHATYVWSIPKFWQTLNDQYRAVEKEIAAINTLGRASYRRTLHFEHEFWIVIHEAASSAVTDGFPRWKNRLLEGLV